MGARHYPHIYIRLWDSRCVKTSTGCLEKPVTELHPYPRIKYKGKQYIASRLVWMLCFGDIPDDICVLHTCDNPPCINPNHLFLGTVADNVADMIAKGRSKEQKKTHCPQGHKYTIENTHVNKKNGKRHCRHCGRDAKRGE